MPQYINEAKRWQKLAGIIVNENLIKEEEKLDANVGLLLKLNDSVKNQINTLISKMPTDPKGSTMTKLPDDKVHITLTSIKSFKPFKDKLKDFQLPEDITFPNVELGNAEFVYREDGKTTYVVAIKNQNDIKDFVDKIYQKIGETNPEPNRFFHITLANNQGGDPFKSIGNVEKSDLIKENENSSLHFFFDLDGVLADMEKGLQQSPEIISLRKTLDDLINNNFPEYKNLVDDKIKEKIKADLPPDAPTNHPLRPLKKAFNNYTSKVFSVASKEGFYGNLPLMPGAKEMLIKAKEISGKKPDILSSPVQGENTSVQEKTDWVKSNFGNLVDKIIIDTDKGKYAKSKNDVLVDDRPKYVSTFETSGGSAILHKNYNDTIKEIEKFKQSLTENKMSHLINEAKRFQKLAGILKENLNEAEDISQEIQALVDKNEFLKGKVTATPADIIEGSKFVLLFSEDAAKHIAERHLDGAKPGSLFKSGVNLRDIAKKLLNIAPSEESGGRVKWLGANGGGGEMGVAKASPEEVAKMKDYTMPDGQKEQVKIAPGKRKPTDEVSLITAELGTLGNGKKALSMITMFPGGTKVDGTEIPMNRGEFAAKGLYFVVDPSSALLKENKSRKKLLEVLDDLKDAQSTAKWVKNQLDEYIDGLSDYGAGYKVEEKLQKILKVVATKFKIEEDSFEVEDKSNTSHNEYGEGTVNGEIKLNGQTVVTYSSHGDGYGFRGDVNENALKAELEKLIQPVSESIEKIVTEALKRHRKMLKEDNSDILSDYFYGRDLKQYTGVTSFEICDEDDWDKVKDYVEKDKENFLEQHPEVTEQEFDDYMEKWIDNIEEARGYESKNQQDMNMDW
jgi:hypothetical protein